MNRPLPRKWTAQRSIRPLRGTERQTAHGLSGAVWFARLQFISFSSFARELHRFATGQSGRRIAASLLNSSLVWRVGSKQMKNDERATNERATKHHGQWPRNWSNRAYGQESREGRILCLLLLLGRASGGNDAIWFRSKIEIMSNESDCVLCSVRRVVARCSFLS